MIIKDSVAGNDTVANMREDRAQYLAPWRILAVGAGLEGLTGLAMLFAPVIVMRLLAGGDISAVTIGVARLGGASLLALATAAWPNAGGTTKSHHSLHGLLTYNVLALALLLYLGIRGGWAGILLWPVVVVHGVLTLLLARMWLKAGGTP